MRGNLPFQGTARAPSLEPLREDGLVKFVTGRERLKKLAEYRAQRFSSLLAKSGRVGNPYALAAKSVSQAMLATAIIVPVAVVLGVFAWHPLALMVVVPALLLRLSGDCSSRTERQSERKASRGRSPSSRYW